MRKIFDYFLFQSSYSVPSLELQARKQFNHIQNFCIYIWETLPEYFWIGLTKMLLASKPWKEICFVSESPMCLHFGATKASCCFTETCPVVYYQKVYCSLVGLLLCEKVREWNEYLEPYLQLCNLISLSLQTCSYKKHNPPAKKKRQKSIFSFNQLLC